jgi:diguanylate cyclase (GGDEF)-like protein
MLYVYIFMFDRRIFLVLWFIGWSIIAFNYSLDAFAPGLLRGSRLMLFLSLCSYFYANLLISWGTIIFLKIKAKMTTAFGIGIIWLAFFVFFSTGNRQDLQMIQYTSLTVFALSFWIGVVMVRSVIKYGSFVLLLGFLNIAWVCNTVIFSYIIKMPQMAPYIVSQIILLLNAVGLILLFFKEQKNTIEQGLSHITYLTLHDELTGLFNKSYFDNKIRELETSDDSLPISLIVGDMNGLKFVNDVFGHQEGDNWLRRVALIFQRTCRPTDITARWGGDEFAAIMPNTDRETALDIVSKINPACKSDQGKDVFLSISLGVATKTSQETDLSAVLKEAEESMYETKLIESRKTRWVIAETLGRMLQEKGYETNGHIERMEALGDEFAQILNFSRENRNDLLQAVRLHDIGKIGIPEEIALKESRLDESERLVVKKHVETGYRIAYASWEFSHLADIILYHHERWDGNGYPQGIKEDEIPLMSRIISILDAFDVMTHRQLYKPAKTVDEALDELSSEAGAQFDPALVSLFINMMNGSRSATTR